MMREFTVTEIAKRSVQRPGRAHHANWQWPALVLVGLCAALYLPGLAALPPVDRDEAWYALAARQMLASGDFVVPRFGDEPFLEKPPGMYWLQATALRAGGGTSAAIGWHRLPSALGATFAVLGVFLLGRRLLAPGAALLGAALLAAAALLVVEAHLAIADAPLLACVVAAQACLARLERGARRGRVGTPRLAAGFWLAQAAGILIKGPVAPLVSALTIAGLALSGGRADRAAGRGVIRALRPWWGMPLAVAVVAPWILAIEHHIGWQALPMVGNVLPKITGVHESHGGPPGLYLLTAPATFWPGSLVGIFALTHGWRRRHRPAERFLLCWLVPAWLLFECLPTKLPSYVLPTLPALALLAGRAALTAPAGLRPPAQHPAVRGAFVAWAGMTIGLGVLAAVAVTALGSGGRVPLAAWTAALAAAVTAGLCLRQCWRVHLPRAVMIAITGATVFYALLLQVALPAAESLWPSRCAAAALAALAPGQPLLAVGYTEPSLGFVARGPVRPVEVEAAAAALASEPGTVTLVAGDQLAALTAAAGRRGIALRERWLGKGFNYSKGRWIELHLVEVAGPSS